jgi:hypothetical protein
MQDLLRPRSAPIDTGFKGNASEDRPTLRMSDVISSLPRLHIKQLHTRLPVFRDISLSLDAINDATDVSSQVLPRVSPPPLSSRLTCSICRLQMTTDTGAARSSQ